MFPLLKHDLKCPYERGSRVREGRRQGHDFAVGRVHDLGILVFSGLVLTRSYLPVLEYKDWIKDSCQAAGWAAEYANDTQGPGLFVKVPIFGQVRKP